MKITAGMVAVITGGAGGIGLGVAKALAKQGCHLALVDINGDALANAQNELRDQGVNVSVHVANVADHNEMSALAQAVIAEHGKVNILHNNAGITLQKSFATHSLADWQRIIGINLWGVIHGCQVFLPHLQNSAKVEGAHIVNMSSIAGFVGMPNQSSYAVTKAAVRALSEAMYAELAHANIGVTSVHPGAIKTQMIFATLQESDNIDQAQQSYKIVERIGNTVDYAAERIVQGVEKNRPRVRIGKDAVITDLLMRFAPITLVKQMKKIARKIRGD